MIDCSVDLLEKTLLACFPHRQYTSDCHFFRHTSICLHRTIHFSAQRMRKFILVKAADLNRLENQRCADLGCGVASSNSISDDHQSSSQFSSRWCGGTVFCNCRFPCCYRSIQWEIGIGKRELETAALAWEKIRGRMTAHCGCNCPKIIDFFLLSLVSCVVCWRSTKKRHKNCHT